MANQKHLDILKQGVEVWNRWRKENPDIDPDLSRAHLSKIWLSGADFSEANLRGIILRGADLREANLNSADLRLADLSWATLYKVQINQANLSTSRKPSHYLLVWLALLLPT